MFSSAQYNYNSAWNIRSKYIKHNPISFVMEYTNKNAFITFSHIHIKNSKIWFIFNLMLIMTWYCSFNVSNEVNLYYTAYNIEGFLS